MLKIAGERKKRGKEIIKNNWDLNRKQQWNIRCEQGGSRLMGSNPWSSKCLCFPSFPTWWSVTLTSPPVSPPKVMIRSGVILMAPLCALLVIGGRQEPPCLDQDWILFHHASLFLLPSSHPGGSAKVIGLEVSPWGVVALRLSHVGSEAFYAQQKVDNGHTALRKPLFCRLAQPPPLGGFFFVAFIFCFEG